MSTEMKRISIVFYTLVVVFSAAWSLPATAEKYKIAYFEGGFSSIFRNSWEATQKALAEQGWGNKIEYPKDAFYSPGFGAENQTAREAAAKELMARDDLSLIFSAGTDATQLLQQYNNKKTPILGAAISDPIRSKLVVDQNDSGIENFTTRLVPGRYTRMFQIFHDEVGFKRLGLLYVDRPNARKFANVEDAEEVSKQRGFEIVHYKINETLTPQECMAALESLVAQKIDAFYMPSLTCFEWTRYDVNSYLSYLRKHKIPTFARQGSEDVEGGALMGFSTVDYSQRGHFLANIVINILEGQTARQQKMVDDAPPKIAINLKVAREIGFDPSFEILGASDEIYNEIALPKERLVK
jgi:ABC-type uncharacterized transport system substrate-binding protein